MEHRRRSEVVLGCEVALDHPINGALPLRVGRSEDLVEDVQINTETLDVVLHRSETEVDQVNGFALDENVVARQVSVRGGHAVEASHRFADTAKHRLGLVIGRRFIVEHVDQRTTTEVFDDELTAFVIKVPNGRY